MDRVRLRFKVMGLGFRVSCFHRNAADITLVIHIVAMI